MQNKFNTSNIIILIVSLLILAANLFAYFYLFEIAEWLRICFIVGTFIVAIVMIVFFALKRFALFRLTFLLTIFLAIFTWAYQTIVWLGYAEMFQSIEAMQNLIAQTGAWGIAVFMLIQFLQVVILPIPSAITTIAGAILFGPTVAMIVSLISILLASYVAFFIGRFLGEKVVSFLIGKELCEKYSKLLYDKGKYLFFLMMLFPFFPDDILCMVAGMTTMKLSFFTFTMLVSRPLAIIPTCYLGGGTIIPYSGWGLVVWAILIILMIVLFILSYKYQAQIEKWVTNVAAKITRKKGGDTSLQQNNKGIGNTENPDEVAKESQNDTQTSDNKEEKNIQQSSTAVVTHKQRKLQKMTKVIKEENEEKEKDT